MQLDDLVFKIAKPSWFTQYFGGDLNLTDIMNHAAQMDSFNLKFAQPYFFSHRHCKL